MDYILSEKGKAAAVDPHTRITALEQKLLSYMHYDIRDEPASEDELIEHLNTSIAVATVQRLINTGYIEEG